jgi:hypothetical protein
VALEDCEVYFYDKNFFLEELKEEEGGALWA